MDMIRNLCPCLAFCLFFMLIIFSGNILQAASGQQDSMPRQELHEASHHEVSTGHHDEVAVQGDGHHGLRLDPLLFIIIALVLGAAIRHLFRKSSFPYTVTLLIAGIVLGLISRLGFIEENVAVLHHSLNWAANIDPHLILYIFIPALIFEAAFSLDIHTFKKIAPNAVILAVPGLIAAMFLTGFVVMGVQKSGLGLHQWDWMTALMFGVVISATDPVAVVSLLKELGVSKKLNALIEGESLMNDGTAIVIFMYFFLIITGVGAENSAVVEFFRVALGGILVGLVVGLLVISWVKHVFNDAMVEISVIIAAAYISFFVAENLLGISGVLSVVAFGLTMSGIGRTRLSPEVEHFLHEFWEFFTFIANTLIFVMVGVLIASRIVFTLEDFIVLLILYIGIHLIRAIIIGSFFPLMKKAGYGMDKKEATVLWWGALRGAIGLALALVVDSIGEEYMAKPIRNQFLFLTAGIVTLTSLINATTIQWLISRLGLTRISRAKAVLIQNAKKEIRDTLKDKMASMQQERYFKKVDWNTVKEYLPRLEESFTAHKNIDTLTEIRRRVLQREKSCYWNLFKQGMLSSSAVTQLSETVNTLLDQGGERALDQRADLENMWKMPKYFKPLTKIPLLGIVAEQLFFERLITSSDCANGFVQSQQDAMALVQNLSGSSREKIDLEVILKIKDEINTNIIHGQTFLRNLRKNFPEVFITISTKQAARSLLNKERQTIDELYKNGQITQDESDRLTTSVEERMKKLIYLMTQSNQPEVYQILKQVPWLANREEDFLSKLLEKAQSRVYSIGDVILPKGQPVYSFYIVLRGNVKEKRDNQDIPMLSTGDTLGESAVITGLGQVCSYIAMSPVTVLQIKYVKLQRFMNEDKEFMNDVWRFSAPKIVQNYLHNAPSFNACSLDKIKKLFAKAEFRIIQENKEFSLAGNKIGVLVHGEASLKVGSGLFHSPVVLKDNEFVAKKGSYLFLLDL